MRNHLMCVSDSEALQLVSSVRVVIGTGEFQPQLTAANTAAPGPILRRGSKRRRQKVVTAVQ